MKWLFFLTLYFALVCCNIYDRYPGTPDNSRLNEFGGLLAIPKYNPNCDDGIEYGVCSATLGKFYISGSEPFDYQMMGSIFNMFSDRLILTSGSCVLGYNNSLGSALFIISQYPSAIYSTQSGCENKIIGFQPYNENIITVDNFLVRSTPVSSDPTSNARTTFTIGSTASGEGLTLAWGYLNSPVPCDLFYYSYYAYNAFEVVTKTTEGLTEPKNRPFYVSGYGYPGSAPSDGGLFALLLNTALTNSNVNISKTIMKVKFFSSAVGDRARAELQKQNIAPVFTDNPKNFIYTSYDGSSVFTPLSSYLEITGEFNNLNIMSLGGAKKPYLAQDDTDRTAVTKQFLKKPYRGQRFGHKRNVETDEPTEEEEEEVVIDDDIRSIEDEIIYEEDEENVTLEINSREHNQKRAYNKGRVTMNAPPTPTPVPTCLQPNAITVGIVSTKDMSAFGSTVVNIIRTDVQSFYDTAMAAAQYLYYVD